MNSKLTLAAFIRDILMRSFESGKNENDLKSKASCTSIN